MPSSRYCRFDDKKAVERKPFAEVACLTRQVTIKMMYHVVFRSKIYTHTLVDSILAGHSHNSPGNMDEVAEEEDIGHKHTEKPLLKKGVFELKRSLRSN
jgi:hypothetical protein